MNQSLDQMLTAAARGDASAWRGLVGTYSGRVYGLVFRRCGDPELAEEITQDTFVRVVERLGEYREQGRFESWLFTIAVNRLRDELRRKGRQAVSVDYSQTPPELLGHRSEGDGDGPLQNLEEKEREEMLRRAVGRLAEQDREIIELRYTAELTFAQIADMLAEPLGTVLARGHRALKKLKQMMEEAEAGVRE